MLGCIQPISSPMINKMLGLAAGAWASAGPTSVCEAVRNSPAAKPTSGRKGDLYIIVWHPHRWPFETTCKEVRFPRVRPLIMGVRECADGTRRHHDLESSASLYARSSPDLPLTLIRQNVAETS